ncbi:MAG: YajD family HNH nuclease [Lentisphaerae bacterium]|nr:YajD family HNH nuclease [Lentisphaerota bacterium]
MPPPKKRPDAETQARILADLRKDRETREQSYRAQALRLFAHVCARCCREFSGKRLRELTVHHKDHDHRNNPPDGSNWELLCLYCHDHEHEKYRMAGHRVAAGAPDDQPPRAVFQPFAGLDNLLKDKPTSDQPPKETP